ncbi:MFS transporter, partial [Pseudomonas aeruginosa]|uniref:MFS transporter n=1 Tax=Pseudomonas aeruginosa TaxID=287 RepID=UPI0031B6A1C5
LLWFSCLLSGLGGTLFDPPRSALVVKLIRPQQRGRFFSLLMMQDSAGAVIGALLGSWLLQYDFRLVCATGAVLFVLWRRSMRGCYQHGNSPPYARPFAKA